MNRCLFIVLLGFAVACGKSPAPPGNKKSALTIVIRSSGEVTFRDSLVFDKETGKLFTGLLRDVAASGAGLKAEIYFKDGRRHGLSKEWHDNGFKSLEGEWQEGLPKGEISVWTTDGLLKTTTIYDSRGNVINRKTVPSEKLQSKVDAAVEKRDAMDKTVWKGELQAQEYETKFIELWDELRGAEKPWQVIKNFSFGKISYPEFEPEKQLGWGVRQARSSMEMRTVKWKEWLEQIKRWEVSGWRLEESEWHQESFIPKQDGFPVSLFKAVVHLFDKTSERRVIYRGRLRVLWGDDYVPVEIMVENLERLSRVGEVPFRVKNVFDLTIDDPKSQDLRNQSGPSIFPTPLVVQDLNKDGLPEVILGGSGLLYWNRGNFQFEKSQLISGHFYRFKAGVLGDFNGDQQVDWFSIGSVDRSPVSPVLFPGKTDGSGFFSEAIISRRTSGPIEFPQCITSGDVDGDGDLDVFVAQYKTPYGGGQMPTPYYDANDGFPSVLLLNDGTGRFVEATVDAGLGDKRFRRTYSASFVDWDKDGDLDLMVVSDFAGIDLYLNDGTGKFTDITSHLGKERYSFGMSHSLADFNGDGFLDIYMVGMGSTTARRLASLGLGKKGFEHLDAAPDMGYGNRLLLGNAKGRFKQASYNDQLARTGWSWGCTPWDFDNDGDRDIYVVNGMLSGRSARDYCTTFWRHDIRDGASNETLLMQEVYNQCMKGLGKDISWNGFEHNSFLMNEGRGNYHNIGYLMGVGFEFDCRSAVGADLDLDGRTDLMVVQMDQLTNRHKTGKAEHYLHLVQNNLSTQGNWVGLHLNPGSNPVGAMVSVRANGKTQTLPVVTGDSYSSQHPNTLHFGLGKVNQVEELRVEKAGRQILLLKNPEINKYHGDSR